MKRKFTNSLLCALLLGLVTDQLFAQNYTDRPEFKMANSHWFNGGSGQNRIFDMRTNPPTVINLSDPNSNFLGESGSGISDTATGDLLFYSNGYHIYNRNHQIMPNGTIGVPGNISTNQQLCIIPMIDTPNKYHVFSLSSMGFMGVYYTVVDMSLDNGLGGVEPGRERLLYDGPLQEAMVGIPGNNCDAWVLVHPYHDSIFMAYHVTAEGLDTVPVISSPGTTAIYGEQFAFELGSYSVSPNRDKIAISSTSEAQCQLYNLGDTLWGGLMIAKFDAETGKVSDGVKVDNIFSWSHHFSSDGSKLYASGLLLDSFLTGLPDGYRLLQYDVTKHNFADIFATRYELDTPEVMQFGVGAGFRRRGDTLVLTNFPYIPFSNRAGAACGYNKLSNMFPGEVYSQTGTSFGTDAIYPLPATHTVNIKDTLVCEGTTLKLEATSGYLSYRWNNGTESDVLTITEEGTYWVEYEKHCNTGVDTFYIALIDFPEPTITVSGQDLSTSQPYDTYQWMLDGAVISGATSSVYRVKANGDYRVITTLGECIDTSAPYTVNNATGIQEKLNNTKVKIYPNPASTFMQVESAVPVTISIVGVEGKVYNHTQNAKQIDIRELADGLYLVEIKNEEGRLLQIEKLIKSSHP